MKNIKHKNLKWQESQAFVEKYHRHSKPLKRHIFSIGAFDEMDNLMGIVTVDHCSSGGWSSSRSIKEIRRLCVAPNAHKGTASFLISKATTALFAMGIKAVISYTKPHESGSSLMGSGFNIYQRAKMKHIDGCVEGGLVTWFKKYEEDLDPKHLRKETKDILDLTHSTLDKWLYKQKKQNEQN